MVRFGLIGAGNVGCAHAESIRHIPNASLAVVADTHPGSAEKVATPMQAQAVGDAQTLLERDDIDAVIIAAPTPFHFFHVRNALEAGKHVYVETPLARDAKEGEELVKLANQKGLTLTVGHSLRGYREYQMMRDRIAAGAIGAPGVVRLSRRTPHPRGWYSNVASSGGVVLDAMIHELDFLTWCFGPVERVFCRGMHGRADIKQLDYALAVLRLSSGAIVHVESSWCHYGQFCLQAEAAGDKGLLRYDNQNAWALQISLIDFKSSGRSFFSESPVIKPAHFDLLERFVQCLEGAGDNPCTGDEGLEALRLADAAAQSMEQKAPVHLNAVA
ncbi:MAG: Gfo/Idh/MocA family oxidoreductase [Candidatus Hinthialibacter antarcticus]|nr:Gfo/Idh/MocA family oxidoreductase [Candidatus Hinthialibacter antarcticus]